MLDPSYQLNKDTYIFLKVCFIVQTPVCLAAFSFSLFCESEMGREKVKVKSLV